MNNILNEILLPGNAVSVIRTKGGTHEERTIAQLCSYLESKNLNFLIVSRKTNNSYNPRIHGAQLLEIVKNSLLSEDLYTIPYPQVLNFDDAKKYSASCIVVDWPAWNKYFYDALKKTIPDYFFIFTVGEDYGACENIVRASLKFSSKVFLTMQNNDQYSLSQIRWHLGNLNKAQIDKLYVSSWISRSAYDFNETKSAREFIDSKSG